MAYPFFSVANDTLNGIIHEATLHNELLDDSLPSTTFLGIYVDGDSIEVFTNPEPNQTDKDTIAATIAARPGFTRQDVAL